MNSALIRLTLLDETGRHPALTITVSADAQVGVRDLSTRAVLSVRAAEISLYRHTVMLCGRAFRVLNVCA